MSIRLRRRTNEMIYASVTLRRDHSKPLNKRSHDPRKWAPKTTQIVKVTRNICFAQGAKQTNKQAQNEIPELYNIVLLKVPNKQAQNEIHELYNMKCLYIFSFFLSFFLCACLLQSHFDRVSDWMKKKKQKNFIFMKQFRNIKKKTFCKRQNWKNSSSNYDFTPAL